MGVGGPPSCSADEYPVEVIGGLKRLVLAINEGVLQRTLDRLSGAEPYGPVLHLLKMGMKGETRWPIEADVELDDKTRAGLG